MKHLALTLIALAALAGCQTQPTTPTGPSPTPTASPIPQPSPKPTPPANDPTHTISAVPVEGEHSANVRVVQERLNALGASLNADGAFGPVTGAAIATFQKSRNLPITSALDDATLSGLGITVVQEIPTPGPIGAPPQAIIDIAAGSKCSKIDWLGRGSAPRGYYKGIALTFAKAVCNPSRPDVQLVSAPSSGDGVHDALTWYADKFAALGMKNTGGVDTLRHTYALMIGLGMRESSGTYCCGRDMSAGFSSADSAEAGTFQASWGARSVASPTLANMFKQYRDNPDGCFLENFKEGIGSCSAANWKNWGVETTDGFQWQRVTKSCPAFSAEYAAVLLRKTGGSHGEFGPLRQHAAELKPECDAMLMQVQKLVESQPDLCKAL